MSNTIYLQVNEQEAQLPLRNWVSAMHFFVAKSLSIAVMIYTYVRHLRHIRSMNRLTSLPHSPENPANICVNLVLPESRVIGLHFFVADSMDLSSFRFSWWAPKNAFCATEYVTADREMLTTDVLNDLRDY